MAVTVSVKTSWGKKDNATFKVNAKTLEGAADELSKRDEWGKFNGKIDYSYDSDENDFVTNVTLKPSYTIDMPVWAAYKKAPKPCQEEWDRMYKALEKHEDGHRLIHLETLATIETALQGKTDYTSTQLDTDFGQMMTSGQTNQDKFDTSTGHGEKKGVTLTITDECA
jgi:predicted secreted Zn-dependent protease